MKSKEQKGITLIALLITIIILLILAGVAITAIRENDIVSKANGAVEKYEDEADAEHSTLGQYNTEMDKYIDGSNGGADSEDEVIEITFTISGVTYKSEAGWDWSRWIGSQYNTINAYINDSVGSIVVNEKEILYESRSLEGKDQIIAGYAYVLSEGSDAPN